MAWDVHLVPMLIESYPEYMLLYSTHETNRNDTTTDLLHRIKASLCTAAALQTAVNVHTIIHTLSG